MSIKDDSSQRFNERLKQRRANDQRAMEEAYAQIATAAMGANVADALASDHVATEHAINKILSFYGAKPVEIPDDIEGVDGKLDYCLRPAGIMRRGVHLGKGWYKDAVGAYLVVGKQTHKVHALIPKAGLYRFDDPETGKSRIVTSKTAELFEEDALCFYEPLPQGKLTMPDLMRFFNHCITPHVAIGIALTTLLATLITAVVPALTRILMAQTTYGESVDLVTSVCVFLIASVISASLMGVLKSLLMSRVKQEGMVRIQAALMIRTLNLPAAFFSQYGSGNLAYRLSNIERLWSSVVDIEFDSLLSMVVSGVYIIQLFAFGRALVLPALGVLLVIAIHTAISAIVGTAYSQRVMEASADRNDFELSALSGIQKVKLAGAEKRIFAQWGKRFSDVLRKTYNMPGVVKYSTAITGLVSGIGMVVIYICAQGNGMEVADFYAFMTAYGLVSGIFVQFASVVLSISQMNSSIRLLRPIVEAEPEVSGTQGTVSKLSGAIEISHVSFRYSPESPLVLNDLSLKVEPGEYVAIVGKSGCGKSTLMRLLLGFEKPLRGGIFYDGKSLGSINIRALRQSIGTVMQDDRLFAGDLFSNIAITAPGLTEEGAWEAAEVACIADDIRAMPMGMNTVVGDGGGGISGGQRQRVAIARAIAGKPSILLFDEATSALDNASQKKISDALGNMGCTRIVIAHRLSTIRQCDRVVVLDAGHIVADGTYDEVYETHLAN